MAVWIDWQKQLPKQLSSFTARELHWLWVYLVRRRLLTECTYPGTSDLAARQISSVLKTADYKIYAEIIEAKASALVDREELSLIYKADSRLISWTFFHFYRVNNIEYRPEWSFGQLRDKSCLIAGIDCDPRSLVEKISILKNLHFSWSSILSCDFKMRWIDSDDDEQSLWLLEKASAAGLPGIVRGGINIPVNSEERVIKFQCILDQSNFPPGVMKAIVEKLGREWSAKGRVKSKNRVQSNALVLPETKSGIEILKGKFGVKTLGEVLDKLVSDAI